MWTLESKDIDFEPVDIADPNKARQKDSMSQKVRERERKPLPPQIFNDDDYIGVSVLKSDEKRGEKEKNKNVILEGNRASWT